MRYCAALVFLAAASSTHSQTTETFGRITEGTVPSGGLSADYKRASRFTMPTAGSITELCAYLDGNGATSGFQQLSMNLYRDNNGVPGAKVFGDIGQTVVAGTAPQWVCSSGFQLHHYPVPAGTYWIAIHTAGDAGVIRDYGDGAANWYGNADAWSDGSSATFGAGSKGTGTLSVYARYFPDSQLRNAGKWTIGSVPSGGMTANFKRGSSFTLPERGKLYSISAYLDGLGRTTPPDDVQNIHYVIYKDANGFPGAKVYEAFPYGLWSRTAGIWWPVHAQPGWAPTLDAGKYWLVLLTGDTGGIIRNFGDGTAGNWYGNADNFADNASDQFGPGNAGNGTITAFMSYRPGTITTGEIGRHEIGTKPSGGLTPNFIRWSEFQTNDINATLTGLHAYLDGLGGASGSQKVRMVIYGLWTDFRNVSYYKKIAQSADVTIPAGMPAQWVHFTTPSVPMDASLPLYVVGIQSGDTGGVVRDYGDSRVYPHDNWWGGADLFADGAADQTGTADRGQGTLSVYATYSIPPPP
jgi:hypothetical protein